MRPRASFPVIAAAAIAVLGLAGAVYVIGQGSGNVAPSACDQAVFAAARLDGANTGEVAAFTLAQRPVDAGALAFKDAGGASRTLAEWKGRTVLLNLWATWCVPCREEMPALQALQKEMGSAGFEVVPVSIDLGTPDKPKKFYADNQLSGLGFYHDGSMGVFNALKKESLAFGLPATLLIDKAGCVLGSLNGPAQWASEDAKALVRRALGS